MDLIPTTEATPELPVYSGAKLADVTLVTSNESAEEAWVLLSKQAVIGFDTESKPTFTKGEISSGPHLVQLAAGSRIFLYPIVLLPNPPGLKEILESGQILKVGFGLGSDLAQLRSRLGIEAHHVLDLSRALPGERPKQTMGAKTAVARYLGHRMQKSKRTTTSNWANRNLTERQILYAANDALVSLQVYDAALAAGHLTSA